MAEGFGDNFDDVTNVLGTYASAVANIVAFATNAAVHHVELFVGVEATPGVEDREFHQQYGQLEEGFPHQGRAIDSGTAGMLITQMLEDGEDRRHIAVAVHHYSVALSRWELGTDVFATQDDTGVHVQVSDGRALLSVGLLTGGYGEDELLSAGAFRVYRGADEHLDAIDELESDPARLVAGADLHQFTPVADLRPCARPRGPGGQALGRRQRLPSVGQRIRLLVRSSGVWGQA